MGERGLNYLAGCARPFRRPVSEARPEPMRHGADAEFPDQPAEGQTGERLSARTEEHKAGAVAPFALPHVEGSDGRCRVCAGSRAA